MTVLLSGTKGDKIDFETLKKIHQKLKITEEHYNTYKSLLVTEMKVKVLKVPLKNCISPITKLLNTDEMRQAVVC